RRPASSTSRSPPCRRRGGSKLPGVSWRRCWRGRGAPKGPRERRDPPPPPPSPGGGAPAPRASLGAPAPGPPPPPAPGDAPPSPPLGGRDTVSGYAGTDLAQLLFSAPAPALRGLGQCGEAAAPPRARWARSLPELGLDGGGAARRLAHHRAGSPRPWG